jgi:hypothetical protein
MAWLEALQREAEPHHDLRALGEVHGWAGRVLALTGDLHGAVSRHRQALEVFDQIGDTFLQSWSLRDMARTFLSLGDPEGAQDCASQALRAAEAVRNDMAVGHGHWRMGQILLCQGAGKEAIGVLRKAVQPAEERAERRCGKACALGWAYLAQGDRASAIERFQEAAALAVTKSLAPGALELAGALGGLEEAYGDLRSFRAFCRHFEQEHPRSQDLPLGQWYLEAVDAPGAPAGRPLERAPWAPDSPDWTWHNPFGDCSLVVDDGLEIHAANGRDLWLANLSAPRFLTAVDGTVVLQTACVPASPLKPALGGLLLWKDNENYLRLTRGVFARQDVALTGCLEGEDVAVGRGLAPIAAQGQLHLRLQWRAGQVAAFCSADGTQWFAVGRTPFPVQGPIQVGVHAIGNIERTIYRGAYPEGTAIRFSSFGLWSAWGVDDDLDLGRP